MSVGNEIRRQREAAGITQTELARVICVSQSAVAQFELGYRTPSLYVLTRIADALGTTPAALLSGPKDMKEAKL